MVRGDPGPKLGGLDVGPMAGLHVPLPLRWGSKGAFAPSPVPVGDHAAGVAPKGKLAALRSGVYLWPVSFGGVMLLDSIQCYQMKYKALRGFRFDPGPFLVARVGPRGFRLGPGNRVIFHHPELIRQLPRQFHRFTCRERLPKFILGFHRRHPPSSRRSISCGSSRHFQSGTATGRMHRTQRWCPDR